MDNLVVVAHPDDEAIWMGGVIIRHGEWKWHVLALCRAGDPDREPQFHASARELGATEYISDVDDGPVLAKLSANLSEIKERIRTLSRRHFDLIFTHGPAGEYTYHARHVEAHRAVSEMVTGGELTGALVTFAYEDSGGTIRPRPAENAQMLITLTSEEFDRKQRLLRGIYNFGPGSFEFDSAGPVEAFNAGEDRATLTYVRNALEDKTCES